MLRSLNRVLVLPVVRRHSSFRCAPAMNPVGISLSHKLWDASRSQALIALYSPFVVSLAAGTLQQQEFQRYIAQDEFFLTAFAQGYEMAKSNTADQTLKSQISDLQKAAPDELKLHASIMKSWNSNATPIPATTAYTDFLLDVASGKKTSENSKSKLAGFTLGAMTPCMRLYAFIGHQVKAALAGGADHPYEDWISTYSSPDFEAAAAQLERLVDTISEEFLPADNAHIQSLYHRAMSCELDFFSAHFNQGTSSIVPLVQSVASSGLKLIFMSDFDSTCTPSDSSPVLAELGLARATPDIKERWNSLSESYFKEYSQLLDSILRPGKDGAFKYDQLKEALGAVSEFEKRGNAEVIASRVLQGIKLEEVKAAAGKMPLEPGCASVFTRLAQETGVPCHILSVCWSQTFIEAALAKEGVTGVGVHSNELSITGGTSDGGLIRRVETPLEKEEFMRKTIGRGGDEEQFVVYVGDSLTDLLCLLEADLGIVVGNSSSLRKAAGAFGVEIVPLFTGLVRASSSGNPWRRRAGTLYSASGWLEIEALLLGESKSCT